MADQIKDLYSVSFASIAELEAALAPSQFKDPENLKRRNAYFAGERSGSGASWYGVADAAEAQRVIREGYEDGARIVDSLYADVEKSLPKAVDFRRVRRRSDQGDALDIHSVNSGNLSRAWETTSRAARRGTGLVRVIVDICANAGTTAQRLQWRGVAALALTRALVRAGYSVEIVAAMAVTNAMVDKKGKRNSLMTCVIKPRNVASDTRTLAASVCMPGFFRIFGFGAAVLIAERQGTQSCSSLGQAMSAEKAIPPSERSAQITVSDRVLDRASAVAWVKQGIELLQGVKLSREGA